MVILRQGDSISTMAVPDSRAVNDARDYVNKAAHGEVGDASVAALRNQARPYFEFLEAVRKKVGSNRLLTKEEGSVNAETVYRLGGGDPLVRFDRDIADVSASLEHLASKLTLDVAHSVVAITVALRDPQFPAASAIAADLDALLVPVEAPVSYEQFMKEMEDPDLTQLTLIARYRDAGLVFSDRWASLAEIAEDLDDTFGLGKKDSLNLVTNGGEDAVDAFAESGRFSRVYRSYGSRR
jgi:hypothetical protein